MSVEVMGLAWYVGGLTAAQKVVLLALADHANDEGRHIYPGVARLTKKTSCGERTVRRALKSLRDAGVIKMVREATHHSPREYRIDVPEMQARQDTPARAAPHDLPESPPGVPESPNRTARAAPNPSSNHHEPSLLTNAHKQHEYIPPEGDTVITMQTTLSGIVKTPLWDKSREDFRDAAEILIGWDATDDLLSGFQPYWDKRGREAKAAGKTYPYPGKPALKSLLEEWGNYSQSLNGEVKGWMDDIVVFNEVTDDAT